MGFEVYVPQCGRFGTPLESGKARLGKSGVLSIGSADLVNAGMAGQRIAVLMDKANGRIALRAARDGEPAIRVKNKTKKGAVPLRRLVNTKGALKELNLDARKIAGDYVLMSKDDLLIVNLLAPAKKR